VLRKAAPGDAAAAGKERACRADVREQRAESKLHPWRHSAEVCTSMDDFTVRTARDHWLDWLGVILGSSTTGDRGRTPCSGVLRSPRLGTLGASASLSHWRT
jgi:hypothetical protein